MVDPVRAKILFALIANLCYRYLQVAQMTAQRLNELTISILSRSAQLVSINDNREAYDFLSLATRFFRYLSSTDQTVPLSDELGILLLYRKLDPSRDIRFRYVDELFPCAFIERLALIDGIGDLLEENPDSFVLVEPGSATDGFICRLTCGPSVRHIGCA